MVQFFKSAIFVGTLAGFGWESAMAFDHSHNEWNAIVIHSVTWTGSTSTVNYKELKANSRGLNQYLKTISEVKNSDFEQWTRDQQLAFLINAYNAWTVKLILDHYPVNSIKDIGGIFSSPWKNKFFKLFGNQTSLDGIEHEKIRPLYNEPRVHFSLVCASKGCPGLRAEAFKADKLSEQLEDSTRRFLNDTSRNRYDSTGKEFQLSSIFKWYKDDFIKAKGSVQSFVLPYMESIKGHTPTTSAPIKYLDYDWSLNEK